MAKKLFKRIFLTFFITILISENLGVFADFSKSYETNGFGIINANGENLPVYTFQKSGNDDENFNILFLGDGYTKEQQENFINDVKKRVDLLLSKEPFRMYSGKINIYAVPTVSNEEGVTSLYYNEKDTYFGVRHWGSITSLSQEGAEKAKKIRDEIEKNYMDKGGTIGTIHVLSNSQYYFGTSTNKLFSLASLNGIYTGGESTVHEIAHSVGNLRDEYGKVTEGVNASLSNKADVVQWEKLLGFRGVGIINNENSDIYFIPSRSCIMMSLEKESFCEVCKIELATNLNSRDYTQFPEDYYMANPDVTIEHSKTNAIGKAYENCRINERNIEKANGHDLEFRTVVQNFSNSEKNFILSLEITEKSGKRKFYEEKELSVAPFKNEYSYNDARESLSVTIKNVYGLVRGDKIVGKVIDKEKNEVVATDKTGERRIFKVNIRHKLKNADGSAEKMKNAFTTTVYVPEGTTYIPKNLKQLNGYDYDGNSLENGKIENINCDINVDFYYRNYFKGTKTKVSENGKKYVIKPFNIENNSTIILALYDGEKLGEVKIFYCNGKEMSYTTDKIYSNAKVMVWENTQTLKPVCTAENVDFMY